MNRSYSESYKASGVDITAGYRAVDLMKEHVQRTRTAFSLDDIGGFGGCVSISGEDGDVLVSGTDGVGTKLKLAFALDRHDTVGRDCVAMCVNDIICTGARPLLFLDYIACGRNVPEKIASIVKGVADGCVEAGCPLVGGETAEMPGFYPEDEYDLAGFSVGIVRRERMLDRSRVEEGDLVLGGDLRSCLITLVERRTRLVLIRRLDMHPAELVTGRLAEMASEVPAALMRTITWDQGAEMASHASFTAETGVKVYFCDPHSPWQRGTNENTNGLVRDYFPKGTDFSKVGDEEVREVQDQLNGRPRQTLGWKSPAEAYAELLADSLQGAMTA